LGRLAREKLYEKELPPSRMAYFGGAGRRKTRVALFGTLKVGAPVRGPAIIESPFTTVVIEPGATAVRNRSGNLVIKP
ncbi:MAG: hypothetical protein AABZ64_09360, partial [Nitrospinota bacterium]